MRPHFPFGGHGFLVSKRTLFFLLGAGHLDASYLEGQSSWDGFREAFSQLSVG